MITKLLLQEKVADINIKLDDLEEGIKVSMESVATFVYKLRSRMQSYDLEGLDQIEVAKINDELEGYYDRLRDTKSSLYFVESNFKSLAERKRRLQ